MDVTNLQFSLLQILALLNLAGFYFIVIKTGLYRRLGRDFRIWLQQKSRSRMLRKMYLNRTEGRSKKLAINELNGA